ncbi:MAG: hypothetical protein NWF06_02320 [Candidatus Bathyarchaeota archaeon]|nr:hypothetical protein [Candidatus Bathyarchaeum sp.]
MNLIDKQINRIDYNTGLMSDLAEGYAKYPFMHSAEHKERFNTMYSNYQRKIDESMELVWALVRAEREGVVL